MSKPDVLGKGKEKINIISDDLSLNNETETLCNDLYEKAYKNDSCEFTGRGVNAIVAGITLIATRKTGDVRTTVEIANAIGGRVDEGTVHQTMKYLLKELELGLILPNPEDFIDHIAAKIGVDTTDVTEAKTIIKQLKSKQEAQNQSARSLAATVIYYVGTDDTSHGKYTQSEIADAADISTLTVRTNYQKYKDMISNEIKPKQQS